MAGADDNAIERILYIAQRAHIYQIPPLTSTKGYAAASWTDSQNPTAKEIFLARLRIRETSTYTKAAPSTKAKANVSVTSAQDDEEEERVTVDILLEDPATGNLFAAAPYRDKRTVQPATDSSRFFAVTVVSPGGGPSGDGGGGGQMKATLGLGFEERSEAIDFGITLQECDKTLGFDRPAATTAANAPSSAGGRTTTARGTGLRSTPAVHAGPPAAATTKKKDWSLKAGETIKVELGSHKGSTSTPLGSTASAIIPSIRGPGASRSTGGVKATITPANNTTTTTGDGRGGFPVLAPPPSAEQVKAERRRSHEVDVAAVSSSTLDSKVSSRGTALGGKNGTDAADGVTGKLLPLDAKSLGFDDGEFGEFQ